MNKHSNFRGFCVIPVIEEEDRPQFYDAYDMDEWLATKVLPGLKEASKYLHYERPPWEVVQAIKKIDDLIIQLEEGTQ